ncbi:hypothetical protein JCM8115_005964 [Rhodotorula mucilaginosa]|uniref:Uncharacterized protein n=1 Tax=Rhodotorula mucilaginosa TaxID=5537 RepID=A0A9P6VZC5_RHOMI|nr:hypothetical protein C6P46_006047 [Rhodotorula mucilaginosa]TKA58315.1 hypothetical protein B0A53_00053 [Rhodotorula sp. CCFEE 5036]
MAAIATTNAAGRPKRKRQRRRRTNVASDDSDSSSSDSSSSSSSSDSDSEDEAPKAAPAAAVAASSSSSSGSSSDDSDDSSGAESDSSSGSDLSFLGEGIADGGRRRGRGRRRAAAAAAATSGTTTNGGDSVMNDGTMQHPSSTTTNTGPRRAPYPERSPSPASKLARLDPREFVPLGTGIFPLLENRIRAVDGGGGLLSKGSKAPKPDEAANEQETTATGGEGAQILEGLVAGDADAAQMKDAQQEQDAAGEATRKRQDRFGDWWRARLVSEFEGDLGKLAAEPGLTPSRLSLLLTSLTTLSSLHTSSTAPASSIWAHNPNASLDPLAGLPTPQGADALVDAAGAGEEWAATRVGGEGDVQVGEEGVVADEQRTAALAAAAAASSEGGKKSKKEKKQRKSLGAVGQEASPSTAAAPAATAAEVDGVAKLKESAEVAVASSPAKKEKKSKKKGRKSGLSEAGGDQMDLDA